MTEEDFLEQLAERPEDRSLRFVFADWLFERGDPRGEELQLSLVERRTPAQSKQLSVLARGNVTRWLGPFAELAVPQRCRVEQGVLRELCLSSDATAREPQRLQRDVRLQGVLAVRAEPGRLAAPLERLEGLLPRLQLVGADAESLQRLEDGELARGLKALELFVRDAPAMAPVFTEDIAEPVMGELEAAAQALPHVEQLALTSDDFFGPELSGALTWAVAHGPFKRAERFALLVRHGTIEGAAQWLLSGTEQPLGEWSVTMSDVRVALRSGLLEVDLARGGDVELPAKVAFAAALIAQLQPLQPTLLEVLLPKGETLDRRQRDALEAAKRRLGSVEGLHLLDTDRASLYEPSRF